MIKRTTDIGKINSVLKHDYIWPRVSDTSQSKADYVPPISDDYHYLYDEGVLFILHENEKGLNIHANVLPESRDKAEEAAKEALRYGFEDLGADEIVARIPVSYPTVYGFALKFMEDAGLSNGEHLLTARAI